MSDQEVIDMAHGYVLNLRQFPLSERAQAELSSFLRMSMPARCQLIARPSPWSRLRYDDCTTMVNELVQEANNRWMREEQVLYSTLNLVLTGTPCFVPPHLP